jgi:hypothetical protein
MLLHNAWVLHRFPTLFLVCNVAISGNEFWEKKDYGQWTQRECKKMLENSPWAKMFGLSSSSLGSVYGYQIQIRSALPIRQALVRQMQINDNYERLSTEQRQEYDKRTDEYLSATFDDIIMHVEAPNPANYWPKQTTETLRNSTFLIPSKNEKIPLLKFEILRSYPFEFLFIFPRQYKGRQVIGENDKSLSLEFLYPKSQAMQAIPVSQLERALIEFKLDRMLINGEIEY